MAMTTKTWGTREPKMSRRKIIYIGGYSRSGSTILDIALGTHENCVSVGEVCYLGDDWCLPHRFCSCGRRYDACHFWQGLFAHDAEAKTWSTALRAIESRPRLSRLLTDTVDSCEAEHYRTAHTKLAEHVRSRSGRSIIVDSSKNARDAAGRALALRQLAQEEVYFIHLVRHPAAVVNSFHTKGSNWAAEGHGRAKPLLEFRAAVGWTLANQISARIAAKLGPGHALRVRCEDLREQPEKILGQIGKFCGIDACPLLARLSPTESFEVGHNVGGNRLRREKAPRIHAPEKTEPTASLPFIHRLAVELVGGKLRSRFGYTNSLGGKFRFS